METVILNTVSIGTIDYTSGIMKSKVENLYNIFDNYETRSHSPLWGMVVHTCSFEIKPNIYLQHRKFKNSITYVNSCQVISEIVKLRNVTNSSFPWWTIGKLEVLDSIPQSVKLSRNANIKEVFLYLYRPARINCIFRFKMELEYEKS